MRDLINGKSRFGDFLGSPEGIATSVLADRLNRLAAAGLIDARPYQHNPTRYEYHLTEMGEAMLPILQAMCRWANTFIPETWTPPPAFMQRRIAPRVLPAKFVRLRTDVADKQATENKG